MEIDSVFLEIGESGRQQVKYVAVLCFLKVFTPFLIMQYIFVGRETTFTCSRGKETLNNACFDNKVATCQNLTFTEPTMVAEWGLVCDRNWQSKATMSILMFGFLVGAFVLGPLADRIGRKTNLVLTLIGMLFFNLVSAITTEFAVYVFARTLVGFFVAGNILSIVVLMTEIVGASWRGLYTMLAMGSYPVGIIALSAFASKVQEWRLLTALVSLIGLPFLTCHWYLIESPRWFLSQARTPEAESVLHYIARGNGLTSKIDINLKPTPVHNSQTRDAVAMLLTRRRLLGTTMILFYVWFVNGASYYGLTFAAGSLGPNIYTSTALSGTVELPAIVLTYLGIENLGRRSSLAGFMVISGVGCLAIQMVHNLGVNAAFATALALLGKMCIAASFKISYLISGEIFATSIRNSSVGLVSGVARVGSILAPFIVMAGEASPGLEFLVFGLLGLTGGLLAMKLPETRGLPLPETVAEMLVDKTKKLNKLLTV